MSEEISFDPPDDLEAAPTGTCAPVESGSFKRRMSKNDREVLLCKAFGLIEGFVETEHVLSVTAKIIAVISESPLKRFEE